MREQVNKDFKSITEWMAHVLIKSQLPRDQPSEALQRRQYIHLMKLAFFLAERTDGPKRGVGAVIVNKDNDIVCLGWNGFPTKSLYGEFPRAAYNENPPRGIATHTIRIRSIHISSTLNRTRY